MKSQPTVDQMREVDCFTPNNIAINTVIFLSITLNVFKTVEYTNIICLKCIQYKI